MKQNKTTTTKKENWERIDGDDVTFLCLLLHDHAHKLYESFDKEESSLDNSMNHSRKRRQTPITFPLFLWLIFCFYWNLWFLFLVALTFESYSTFTKSNWIDFNDWKWARHICRLSRLKSSIKLPIELSKRIWYLGAY